MFNCAAHPFYLKNDDNVDDNDGSDDDAVVTKTGSDDDESKKGDDKSESEKQRRKVFQGYGTSHEIWPNLQDMEGKSCCRLPLIMHTINLSKVSFLPFHSIACSCDNTKTLSQCM